MSNSRGIGLKVALLGPICFAVFAAGCGPDLEFPPEPRIEYRTFVQSGAAAKLTIYFTDGDGDIGLDPSDTQWPYDTASEYYHNFFLTFEELQDGIWVRPELELENNYRIPRITPAGQNKTLQGEIAVDLFWPIRPGSPYDTVRFEVMIVDRALNESNRVFTDPIVVVD
ncbi:MAG: hypothetical protein M3R08_00755 [Bacteroidota bacterium]|nr:hypothetical protein [Bacteroidota bacterium]